MHNTAFQVILILVLSLWFFGWVGTLFLSSTRVIFAAAFDRVLPDRAAEVSEKRKVPVWSLILMLLPAAGLSARVRLLEARSGTTPWTPPWSSPSPTCSARSPW